MNIKFLVSVAFCYLSFNLAGQPWMENTTDEKGNLNFFLIQKNAKNYFEGKPIGKGKGFKPFKRWEWYWETRVNEDGSFPPAGINKTNFEAYLRANKIDARSVAGNWTSMGPTNTTGGYAGLGRINCVAFHPSNSSIIWVGAASGGLWKSTNGGNSWTTNTDQLSVLGISSIIIHPTDPNIMYIATGDGNASDTYSIGVLKSTDGGVTWNTTGLNWTVNQGRVIRRMVMDPDDVNALLIASNAGLYRTTNAGSTWTQISNANFYDVRPNPDAASNTFYAATSTTIRKSTDNGANFTTVATITGAGRIALAVTPANANYVYALVSRGSDSGFLGLHKSTNAGTSFIEVSNSPNLLGWSQTGNDTGGQGWYDLCIAADPVNPEIVYTGGVNTWKSINGGANWTLNTMWYNIGGGIATVHADKHCMEWQNNTTLWQGNDGGIYVTTNGGTSWTDKSNSLVISQMYRLGVSQADAKVITGLQDNGTKLRGTTGLWVDEIGGDGMECAIHPSTPSTMYGSLYYGEFQRSTNSGSNWTGISPTQNPSGAWVTPFQIDPNTPSTIYTAYSDIYKSTNQGTNWTTIGTGLGTDPFDMLNVAPSNSNIIYAARSGSTTFYKTTNGGTNWESLTFPAGSIRMLAIHPTDPNTLWAVRGGYTNGSKVFKSINGGTSWTNISGNLPNLPANCIVYENGSADGIYVGMDVGVYYRDNDLTNWQLFNTGIPNVVISELEIKYNTSELIASTYGRGLWKSDLYTGDPACLTPLSFILETIGINNATISWTAPTPAPSSGYEYDVTTGANPPASGTATTSTSAVFNSLTSNTNYYFHVRSNCGSNNFSAWTTTGPHRTMATCEDQSFDTGGPSANYSNNENIVRIICPNIANHHVRLTFTGFHVEADWDALYVFNGNTTTSPMFSSGNPATMAGFPAGGYYGTTLPGPFVSTHSSGCLTLQFRSDEAETFLGWLADVDCDLNCTNEVSSTLDSGFGSLRHVISCATDGATINFGASLEGDTINLTSAPLSINKNLTINLTGKNIHIKADNTGAIMDIQAGKTLNLTQVKLISGTGANQTRGIINAGTLNANGIDLLDRALNAGTGQTILNQGAGAINMSNLIEIRGN